MILGIQGILVKPVTQVLATMNLPTIPLHVLFAQTLWLTVLNAPLVLNARRAARGTQDKHARLAIQASFKP